MNLNLTVHSVTALGPSCVDPAWLCWIETHPGLAGWVQALGVLATIIIAILSPMWSEYLVERRLKRTAAIKAANAASRAAGSAEAFVQGADGWGEDPAFDRAFPRQAFESALADLRSAETNLPHLGLVGPALARFSMAFVGFVDLTQQMPDARRAGKLPEFVEFMRRRCADLANQHRAIVRALGFEAE